MGEEPSASGTPVTGTQDPEQLQREIEETREELGDTVEALAAKTDVKARARQKLDDAKSTASEKKEELFGKAKEASPDTAATAASQASQKARENPLPVAAAGAFAAGFVLGRFTKR